MTMPALILVVALTTEQQRLTMLPARDQHEYRIGFIEPRQITKIAILAKRVLHITITNL